MQNIIQMGENKKIYLKLAALQLILLAIKKKKAFLDIYKKYGGVGSFPNIKMDI